MLSSAHILAMDAKNLLDVIDSIRITYPGVDQVISTHAQNRSSNSPARTRSSVSSGSASSSAASSLEKHREPSLGQAAIHHSRASPLVLRPSIT